MKNFTREVFYGTICYLAHNEQEFKDAIEYYCQVDCSQKDDEYGKIREDYGTTYGMKTTFFILDTRGFSKDEAVVILVPEGYKPPNLKEQILTLCEKHGVEYSRIKYYKQSPYQKARYKSKYVGEEVWLKVNGFNYCFNSIDNCSPLGRIDYYFESVLGDSFKIK